MIQFDALRKDIDPPFLALVAELETAYYRHWKRGEAHAFQGFDVQATPDESKALFDKLHGAIWRAHAVAIAEENEKQGRPYDIDKVDPTPEGKADRRSVEEKKALKDLKAEGMDIPAMLATRGVTVPVD